jgi:predicted nucleic acid-binding protein
LTVRATLDSNILIYAELEPETPKGIRAQRVIEGSAPRGVIAAQALLEFVAVVRRRRIASLPSAVSKVEAWSAVFEVAATTNLVAAKALTLVREHQFQVWDAVIWSASREAGATLFLSEDLQDGLLLDGMRVVNPFVMNDADLASLFGG